MADSDAVRQARRRRHVAGDHSACRHGGASPRMMPVAAGSGEDLDPVAALRDLALRLQAAHVADPSNTLVSAELRATLVVIAGSGEQADPLAALTEFLSEPVPYSPPGV